MKAKNVIMLFCVFLITARGYGEARVSTSGAPVAAAATTATPTPVTTPTPSAENMKGLVGQTSTQQGHAAQIGMVVGAGLAATAAYYLAMTPPQYPTAAMYAAGSVLAIAASRHNSAKAAGNYQTSCELTAGGCGSSSGTTTGSTTGTSDSSNGNGGANGSMNASESSIRDTLRPLVAKGFNIDYKAGTVTTPDGKTFSGATVSSPSALAALGVSSKDALKFTDLSKKLEKDGLAKAAEGMLGDSVEGSGARKASAGGDSYPMGAMPGLPGGETGLGINRDPAQVAGLKTSLNGEPIGVAADSIFGIVDRRYELHQAKGSFLTP